MKSRAAADVHVPLRAREQVTQDTSVLSETRRLGGAGGQTLGRVCCYLGCVFGSGPSKARRIFAARVSGTGMTLRRGCLRRVKVAKSGSAFI